MATDGGSTPVDATKGTDADSPAKAPSPPEALKEAAGAPAAGGCEEQQDDDDATEGSPLLAEGAGAAKVAKKKKWGIPLSGIINTIVVGTLIGVGSLGVYYGWHQKYIMRSYVEFIAGVVWGSWSGLRLVGKYRKNRRRKDRVGHILGLDIGEKGVLAVTRGAPYWLTLAEDEKVEWLNSVVRQAWPFYESAICKQVVEQVEPVLQKSKPPFIQKLFFKKMTFGGVPFKLTHMKIVRVTKNEIVLEAGLRWDGTAQIALGVQLLGAQIAPSITRINFFAQARITLARLCDKIPGFGVMLVAFQNAPLVTFDLNCGAGIGQAVEAWLQPFLANNILGTMFVWPNRLVLPVLPEEDTGPLDKFKLRTRGILRVRVVEARGLKRLDVLTSKGDPYCILETVPLHPVKTKIITNTVTPKWDEELFLKVQEVEQSLHLEMFDWDNPAMAVASFSGDDFYGRASVCMKDLPVGEQVDKWYPLGKGGWGQLGGPGSGEGEVHLILTYMTLESLREGHYSLTPMDKERNVHHGMLFCWVEGAHNLVSVDRDSKSDPYCTLWCQNDKKATHSMKDTLDPEWNEYYEWPNVAASETLFVEVHDKGKISDKLVGRGKIPIADVAQKFCEDNSLDSIKVNLPLETTPGTKGTKGDVILHLEWIPLDALPIPKSKTQAGDLLFETVERGVLFVRLVHGRGLKNVDTIGKSDPYVKFKLAGGQRKSKIINNNLNPDWNETFKWDSAKAADVVKIEVKDDDMFKNQILGVYEISVSYAVKPPATVQTFKCKLTDRSPKKKPGDSAGYLVIQMYWVAWNSFGDMPQPPEPEWPAIAGQ